MELIKERKYFFGGIVLFLVVLITLLILYPQGRSFFIINGLHTDFLDLTFKYLTHLGDGITAVIVFCLLLLFYRLGAGLFGLLGLGFVGLSSYLMKYYIFTGHPRPHLFFWRNPVIHYVEGLDVNIENSFPSGHTFTAFYVCTFICLLSIGRKTAIQLILLSVALISGYSRVYLAQHFIGDVVAGAFLGISVAIIFYTLYHNVRRKDIMRLNLASHLLSKKG